AGVARTAPQAFSEANGTFLEDSWAACSGGAGTHEPRLLQVLRLHPEGSTGAGMGSEPHQSNDRGSRYTLRQWELQRGLSGKRIPESMAFAHPVPCGS